jgi:hypothetical protein
VGAAALVMAVLAVLAVVSAGIGRG